MRLLRDFRLPLLLQLIFAVSAFPASLDEAVGELLARPAAQRAVWGVHAVWLDDGSPLYSHNSEKLFTPASTGKLYSTALALELLGGDRRFHTLVTADTPVLEDGSLPGDLRLVGGGDPNFSSRVLPYHPKNEFDEDRMLPMRELAQQLVEGGLRRVQGDIVGDDTRYVRQPHPPGWSIEDAVWGYGAPVSALSFNDNAVEILIRPGAVGQPARLRFDPAFEYLNVANRTKTARTRRVSQRLDARRRSGESAAIDLWGQISSRSPGREMTIAVDDAALFAATALRTELEALGVEIEGAVRAEHLEPYQVADLRQGPAADPAPEGQVLARRTSPPLSEILAIVNKSSQNLHAEMLLRESGLAAYRIGTLEAGIGALRDFLKAAGLSPWEFYLGDGSGLSRKSLVSPAGTVKLLRAADASTEGALFRNSLAVGGVDGTLDWRFSEGPLEGRLHAKTGTLSHVTALAGYAAAHDGREFAFAIFVNNFGVSTSYIRNLVDRAVETMAANSEGESAE